MNTKLPAHYAAAIRFALDHLAHDQGEFYSPMLHLFVQRPPSHRSDLTGQIYLESFERVPGGVTFLNAWRPADPHGVHEFFRWLMERRTEFVSPRPYRLAQSCDGTIGSPVLHAYKTACDALGLNADHLYKTAYPALDDDPPTWNETRRHAEWQGGVVWPKSWDAQAITGLAESLTEINYHSLRSEFVTAAETAASRSGGAT